MPDGRIGKLIRFIPPFPDQIAIVGIKAVKVSVPVAGIDSVVDDYRIGFIASLSINKVPTGYKASIGSVNRVNATIITADIQNPVSVSR